MGMIQEDGGGGKEKGGKKRAKKASTHIDMTPMVDLAFLLLTFFMLTTSFSKPTTMEIIMPKKKQENVENQPPPVDADRVVNILIGEGNNLYYYHGIIGGERAGEITKTDYSANGIRKVIVQKIEEIKAMDKVPLILIKPVKNAKYKHVVDIFDEMNITDAPSYALVPILDQELEKIQPTNN